MLLDVFHLATQDVVLEVQLLLLLTQSLLLVLMEVNEVLLPITNTMHTNPSFSASILRLKS
jgi:hypothetical protein